MTTYYVSRDTRIARRTSDSWDAGAGASDFLPFGLYGGYQYRTLLYFNINMSTWTSVTSATLHVRTSNQYYVAFGSSPTAAVQRLTASFTEGTSVSLSSSNATIYPGPSATSTHQATFNLGTAENTWKTVDITSMMADCLGGTFIGVRLIAWNGSAESTSSADVGEIYAREYGSYDAYITLTYATNTAPTAPTITSPTTGGIEGVDPTLAFAHNDSDGDALLKYDFDIATDSGFTSLFYTGANLTTGITGNNVSTAFSLIPGMGSLSRGTLYYYRVRTYSSTGIATASPWSATRTMTIASLPTVTLTEPSAAGRLGKLSMTGGSGWSSPRLNVAWTFNCPDGGTQQSYTVQIANDSAGSPGTDLYNSGTVSSTGTSLVVPATLTEGSYYHCRVKAVCSHGETSSYSGYFRVRTRWGVVAHRKDLGSAPTSWSISTLNTTTGASSSVVMEYGSDTAANATPSSGWKATVAEPTLARYFYYRTWLLSWGASPATSPSLDKLVLTYSAVVLVPDKWTRSVPTKQYGDTSTFVYGTQSLRMDGDGTTQGCSQLVTVVPNTDYILSGRIKSSGNSGALLTISSGPVTGAYVGTTAVSATQDFTRTATVVWNSGSNTSVYIVCRIGGAAGTTAWFDAIKMEASSVVTPWTPSFLADAVVMDAGGLQIDASAGGIFRLRGSTGGTRDRVDLGANGLVLGGDVAILSPAAGQVKIDNTSGTADQALLIGDDSILYDLDVADMIGVKGQQTAANGGIVFGSGKDTNLYRGAADTLATDDALDVSGIASLLGGVDSIGTVHTNTTFTISGGGTATFGSKSLVWQQIGSWVFVTCTFSVTAVGSGTTTVTITGTGLPQTASGARLVGDRGGSGVRPTVWRVTNSGGVATFTLGEITTTGFANTTGADLANGSTFTISGIYRTTDAWS